MTSLRHVRRDEWAVLRDVRLRALRDAPEAFVATADEAEREPEAFWRARANRASQGETHMVVLAFNNQTPIGMAAGGVHPEKDNSAELMQMWVDPDWRCHGIGSRMVDTVAAWARERTAVLWLGVATDNPAAIRLYERCGFVATGEHAPFPRQPDRRIAFYERAP